MTKSYTTTNEFGHEDLTAGELLHNLKIYTHMTIMMATELASDPDKINEVIKSYFEKAAEFVTKENQND